MGGAAADPLREAIMGQTEAQLEGIADRVGIDHGVMQGEGRLEALRKAVYEFRGASEARRRPSSSAMPPEEAPSEVVAAALKGDEAELLAWLDSGGRVNATSRSSHASGVFKFFFSVCSSYVHSRRRLC